jgi:ferredoxin-NADP reductase
MKEYKVKVIEVIKRTPTAVSIRMEKPEGFVHEPGQWAVFSIKVNDSLESRPLSFSSSPTEKFLEFTKGITGSAFSAAVLKFKPGDLITFKGPAGVLVYKGGEPKVTFMAGGIGITPVRSILKYLFDTGDTGQKTLLYASRNYEETAFLEEIRQWGSNNVGLDLVQAYEQPPEGWGGPTGFITPEMIQEHIPDLSKQKFFVSGPPAMVGAVMNCFKTLEVPDSRVKLEELKGYEGMV